MTDMKLLKLMSLARLDVDAIAAYDAAIEKVTEPMVKAKLSEFRVDHARHVQDLNALIQKLGGTPVSLEPDLVGAGLKAFTSASGLLGTEGVLFAMISNESQTNLSYDIALRLSWEPEEKEIIQRNHADERRHISWITMAAFKRPWRKHAAESEQQATA